MIALLLVLLNGFFVLAEFALVKVRATRIEELVRLDDTDLKAKLQQARAAVASIEAVRAQAAVEEKRYAQHLGTSSQAFAAPGYQPRGQDAPCFLRIDLYN